MAIIAAPGIAFPGSPPRCRVPSTNTPRRLFSRTASRASRTASRSDSPRRTESVPNDRISGPSPGTACASALARKTMRRGQSVPTTGTSIQAAWFTARTAPPSRGTRSRP